MFNNLLNKYVTGRNIMFAVVVVLFIVLAALMQDVAIMFFAFEA